MVTADQLLCHVMGDYILQSHWMATEKTRKSFAAAGHALFYGLPFWFLHPSVLAWTVIVGTHFVIDRWRLARFVVWAKNIALCPPSAEKTLAWWNCKATGYPADTPPWLSVWLLIIADNIMHVAINAAALRWL